MVAVNASISERVGRYQLLAELGQGGTANVYVACVSGPGGFNKLVVLKKMKRHFAGEPGFAEMFMVEARLAAKLNHPNIVQTYEVFDDEQLPVIVMEYLEGKSLADVAVRRSPEAPFTLQHYLTAVSEALSGLHYSHELTDYKGRPLELVHRDVTPHNVFVSYSGQVKILDFGIAKLNNSTVETETGIVKGKLRYIPPEQMIGDELDRRADIYSVGVMLWEAAVGEKMWRGLGDAAVMNRVLNEEVPRPSEKAPNVDPRLEAVIMKALSADPDARQQTALELQQELDVVRKALPNPVTPRELGPALESMFGADRAETREEVERRLASATSAAESRPPPRASSTTASIANVSTRKVDTARMPLAVWLLAAGVLAVLLIVAWPAPPVAPSNTRATTVLTIESPASPSERKVRITVFPRNANLRIDGQSFERNPLSITMPVDDTPHVVVVTAPGYTPQTRSFTLDEDVELIVHLHPAEEPPAPTASADVASPELPKPKRPARAPKPPPRAPQPPSEVDRSAEECSPPYVVDERGIKRFKLECVK